jgi:polysaccharide pyruvyl transferase WcaK-like protein
MQGVFWKVAKFPSLVRREVSHLIESRKFVKGFDLLLVSGGGQLDDYWGGPWGHPYSLLKWGLIARTIGARYAFLGVGTCALESRLSTFFIRQALRLAAYRSYRDQTSKKLLEEMAFTHGDPVGPDLAFSYEKTRLVSGCVSTGSGKTIGISPITYLRHNWPKKDKEVYERYLTSLVAFISGLIQRGYSILLFTTNSPDRHGIGEIVDLLSQGGNLDVSGKIHQARTDTLDELFSSLEKVDCVVASRLHGVILGHLMQKPVLAISYDRKVDTYMNDTGFPEYCLDIHNVNVDSLMKAFEAMVADEEKIALKLQKIGTDYARLLDRQYKLVLER